MKKKNYIRKSLMILLTLLACYDTEAKTMEFHAINRSFEFAGDLDKYFNRFRVFEIKEREITDFLNYNGKNAPFVLKLDAEKYGLNLEINDMRGISFKAVEMTEGGTKELPQHAANTYKGFVNEISSDIARLTIDDSTFEGYLMNSGKLLFFDKLNRYRAGADDDLIVVYDPDDVINMGSFTCGAHDVYSRKSELDYEIDPNKSSMTGNCYFLEIATEADYDYYVTASSNAGLALQRIRSILNLVEGFYTPAFNVKFIIKFQRIWTTASDPYSGDSLQAILPQFQSEWNTNMTAVDRDITQMFTSRTLLNSTIGLAYISVVCSPGSRYSVVSNNTTVANNAVCVVAHELGHNFSAGHDTGSCNGNIMCPGIQINNLYWSAGSINAISNYLTGLGTNSCLTETFPSSAVIAGSVLQQNYIKAIASNDISIFTTVSPVTLSNTGFGYLEAGSSVVLAPTQPNSVGFIAPEGSSVLIRISDVINSCDQLFARHGQLPAGIKESIELSVYPNPFCTELTIRFSLPKDDHAEIKLKDVMGREVMNVTESYFPAGNYEHTISAAGIPTGIYFISLQGTSFNLQQKVIKVN